MICGDCETAPNKICVLHAQTDNLVPPEELELDQERAEHRRTAQELARSKAAERTLNEQLAKFEPAARTAHGYLEVLLSLEINWSAISPADHAPMKTAIARIRRWADDTAQWLNPPAAKGGARG